MVPLIGVEPIRYHYHRILRCVVLHLFIGFCGFLHKINIKKQNIHNKFILVL